MITRDREIKWNNRRLQDIFWQSRYSFLLFLALVLNGVCKVFCTVRFLRFLQPSSLPPISKPKAVVIGKPATKHCWKQGSETGRRWAQENWTVTLYSKFPLSTWSLTAVPSSISLSEPGVEQPPWSVAAQYSFHTFWLRQKKVTKAKYLRTKQILIRGWRGGERVKSWMCKHIHYKINFQAKYDETIGWIRTQAINKQDLSKHWVAVFFKVKTVRICPLINTEWKLSILWCFPFH